MTAAATGRRGEPVAGRRPAAEAPGLLTRLRRDALQALAAGPLYRHTLIGRVPADLRLRVGQRWPGDAKRGAAIAEEKGTATWGQTVELPPPSTEEAAVRLFADPLIRGPPGCPSAGFSIKGRPRTASDQRAGEPGVRHACLLRPRWNKSQGPGQAPCRSSSLTGRSKVIIFDYFTYCCRTP